MFPLDAVARPFPLQLLSISVAVSIVHLLSHNECLGHHSHPPSEMARPKFGNSMLPALDSAHLSMQEFVCVSFSPECTVVRFRAAGGKSSGYHFTTQSNGKYAGK